MKYYRIEKHLDKKNIWLDYGPLPEEDVKAVLKGYKRNDLLSELVSKEWSGLAGAYTRKGTLNFYTVTEI